MSGKSITRVHKVKSLGLLIDEHLTWKDHVYETVKKISKAIGALKRVRAFISAKTALQIYHALIRPYFDHCSSVWGECSVNLCDKLQKLQNMYVSIYLSWDPRKDWGMPRSFCDYNKCSSSNLPVSNTSLMQSTSLQIMWNVRSRSCEHLSVVISVVRHSPCEGYCNARMTLQVTYKVTTFPKLIRNVEEHAGKFDLPTHQQECMWICPNHSYNIGRNYRRLN